MSEKITVEGNAEKLEYFNWHLEKLGLSKESETAYSGNFDSGEEIKHNPPNAKGKYRCVYCGKWFDEDRIVVDHIYPASRVASDPALQMKMKKMGIDNVNSLENLVPACEACVEKKGNRIGNWPKKAKRGLKDSYWIWKPIIKASTMYIIFWQHMQREEPEDLDWNISRTCLQNLIRRMAAWNNLMYRTQRSC